MVCIRISQIVKYTFLGQNFCCIAFVEVLSLVNVTVEKKGQNKSEQLCQMATAERGAITRGFTINNYSLLSRHPPLSGHFPKSRFICQLTVVFDTSIQRPPLLSGRGHHFAVASVLFIWFLTSIKRPAEYLYKHLTYYLNKSPVKYLDILISLIIY